LICDQNTSDNTDFSVFAE